MNGGCFTLNPLFVFSTHTQFMAQNFECDEERERTANWIYVRKHHQLTL